MTTNQKEKKLENIRSEVSRLEDKIEKLLYQRNQLIEAYKKIKDLDPKDPKPESPDERLKKSEADKKKYQSNLQRNPIKRIKLD